MDKTLPAVMCPVLTPLPSLSVMSQEGLEWLINTINEGQGGEAKK